MCVRYTGRLGHNNCIFDSNTTSKKPFVFCLGKSEVVRGWDEGLKGMREGGKRKLSLPPSQGFVAKKRTFMDNFMNSLLCCLLSGMAVKVPPQRYHLIQDSFLILN